MADEPRDELEEDDQFSRIPRRPGTLYFLTEEEEQRFNRIGETDDLAAEAQWVHHHLSNMNATALNAPSRGAWNIYCEIKRRERRKRGEGYDWFYKIIMQPAMRELNRRKEKEAGTGGDYMPSAAERKSINEIKELLATAVEESKQWGDA